jgi:hypothetical protein
LSYDVAVFEPQDALRERSAFLAWFKARTQWGARAYDPTNATPRLQAWFNEMIETYPPMNTPNRPSMNDVERWEKVIDYAFAEDMVYVAVSGARGAVAYQLISRLAAKHGIGVYDLSDNGDVWFPTADGRLEAVLRAAD